MEVVMLFLSVQALFGLVGSPYHNYGLYAIRLILSKAITTGNAVYRGDDRMWDVLGGE
jgi:hypothetical protein